MGNIYTTFLSYTMLVDARKKTFPENEFDKATIRPALSVS